MSEITKTINDYYEFLNTHQENVTSKAVYPRHKRNCFSYANSCASRSKRTVEVWTPKQKKLLADIDALLAREITR